jgi:aminoglycoside 6'-N-acetyltransferase
MSPGETADRDVVARTDRLVLRRLHDGDAAAFAAYRSDPEVARFQSWEAPYGVDQARALIAGMRDIAFAEPGAWLQVGIEAAGRLVGDVAVHVDGDDPRLARLGFTLAPDAQGHGYASEAVRAVIHLLVTEHAIHRVSADCDVRNARSWALLERVGMRREAHHRQSVWWKGEWTDEYVYAVLAEEWSVWAP